MNLIPLVGSLTLLVFAACLVAVSHLSTDADGPLFERGRRVDVALQLAACIASFVAGCQL